LTVIILPLRKKYVLDNGFIQRAFTLGIFSTLAHVAMQTFKVLKSRFVGKTVVAYRKQGCHIPNKIKSKPYRWFEVVLD
jgi:hypothetical protein